MSIRLYTYDLDYSYVYYEKTRVQLYIATATEYLSDTKLSYIVLQLGLSLICSKTCLLPVFLPKLPKIFTYCSYFIHRAPPIIPFLFYCVNDDITMQLRVTMYNLHSQLYLLTALIDYLTVLLEYLDLFAI